MVCLGRGNSLRLPSSAFRPPPSVLRLPSSAFRPPPSVLRLPSPHHYHLHLDSFPLGRMGTDFRSEGADAGSF